MRPKIHMPRNVKYRPISRLHRRTLTYCFGIIAVFGLIYLYYQPIDRFAVPFEQHTLYMNEPSTKHRFVAKDTYDWRKAPFHNKVESYTPLPAGPPHTLPPIQFKFPEETASRKKLREQRRVAVRKEFERSWDSYRRFAWGRDELMPLSGKGDDTFGGWGATLVDSLDTLWIMGFKKEFYEAVEAVSKINFGESEMVNISVFETTIRYLGGLLAAYDLSHEPVLLEKAIQLGEMLYRAFDTENNMPLDRLSIEAAKLVDGDGFVSDSNICFAGIGSLTMEFTRLAQITQQPKYYDAVARVTSFFDKAQNSSRLPGLFPVWINAFRQDISQDRTFTMGAMADSTYEYFPKMFALLGGLEPVYEKLYKESAPLIDKYLLYRPMIADEKRGEELLFSGDAHARDPENVSLEPEMQHLTCFIGGFYGLAGKLFQNDYHVDLGAKLTEGCIFAYESMPTGIMPEIFNVAPCDDRKSCPWNSTRWEEEVLRKTSGKNHADFEAMVEDLKLPEGFTFLRDKRYLLRPEAIESVFIMHRITGHEEYMDHAWDMFTSVRKHSTARYGNGQIFDVTDPSPTPLPEDKMESFWLAETLKYFYLIFSPPDMIDLDDWVFNTEAHPFRRPKVVKMESGAQL